MRVLTPSLTAVVAYSRDFTMSSPIAGVPLKRAADCRLGGARLDVGDLAERDELAVARGDDERGEILRALEPPLRAESIAAPAALFTLPTGAARFCARSAVTT